MADSQDGGDMVAHKCADDGGELWSMMAQGAQRGVCIMAEAVSYTKVKTVLYTRVEKLASAMDTVDIWCLKKSVCRNPYRVRRPPDPPCPCGVAADQALLSHLDPGNASIRPRYNLNPQQNVNIA